WFALGGVTATILVLLPIILAGTLDRMIDVFTGPLLHYVATPMRDPHSVATAGAVFGEMLYVFPGVWMLALLKTLTRPERAALLGILALLGLLALQLASIWAQGKYFAYHWVALSGFAAASTLAASRAVLSRPLLRGGAGVLLALGLLTVTPAIRRNYVPYAR